jgi:hypothetical protein
MKRMPKEIIRSIRANVVDRGTRPPAVIPAISAVSKGMRGFFMTGSKETFDIVPVY